MTAYQAHVAKWSNCTRCLLCSGRDKVVLARGRVPCDVVLIGESPGGSENILGVPFVGPAGKLLDGIIERAFEGTGLTYSLTNLVSCIPRDLEEGGKTAEPPTEAIKACAERLWEFMSIAKPRLIVTVGALPTRWIVARVGALPLPPLVAITHPAAIIRANLAQQGLLIQKSVVTLMNALEDLCQSPIN